MKMKSLPVFLLFVILAIPSKSQEISRNNFYLEVGGAAFLYSINYERLMFKNPENNLSIRLGVTYLYSFNNQERQVRGMPISISYLKHLKKNYLEIGLSGSALYDTYFTFDQYGEVAGSARDLVIMPSLRIGIRHQPLSKGFFWNALLQYSITVVGETTMNYKAEVNSFPFISIGLGHSF